MRCANRHPHGSPTQQRDPTSPATEGRSPEVSVADTWDAFAIRRREHRSDDVHGRARGPPCNSLGKQLAAALSAVPRLRDTRRQIPSRACARADLIDASRPLPDGTIRFPVVHEARLVGTPATKKGDRFASSWRTATGIEGIGLRFIPRIEPAPWIQHHERKYAGANSQRSQGTTTTKRAGDAFRLVSCPHPTIPIVAWLVARLWCRIIPTNYRGYCVDTMDATSASRILPSRLPTP